MAKLKEDDDRRPDRDIDGAWKELEGEDPLLPLARDLHHQPPGSKRGGNGGPRPTAFLDGLRGLAAFLVYMSHHVVWWYGAGAPMEEGFGYKGNYYLGALPFVRSLFAGGSASVAIFFVLSGYVLSVSPLRMLRDGKRRESYRALLAAVVKRPFRLFVPPIGVALIFLIIMHLPFGLAPKLQWPEALPNIFAELNKWVVESVHMMNPFEPHGVYERWYPYDPPVWTMAIEFRGSMAVYFLVAAFSWASPMYRAYLFLLTGWAFLMTYNWSLSCFMFGVALAINDVEGLERSVVVFKRLQLSDRVKGVLMNVLFFTAWWILCQPASTQDPAHSYKTPGYHLLTRLIPTNYFDKEYWRYWNALGAAMLVYAVLRLRWLQRFFLRPSLQFMGRVSFSFYLIHIPFLWSAGDRIYRVFGRTKEDFPMFYDNLLPVPDIGPKGFSLGFLCAQAVILPLNLLIAEFGTRILDEPSIRVGKWVVTRLGLK